MTVELAHLTDEPFARIHQAFQDAFADYQLDMSYLTEQRLRNRMVKNGVDFTVSTGAFAGGRLVGFLLIGLDRWDGTFAAYAAATGIVPDYRGQGLARRMLDHSLPRLRERGVERFVLEVLQANEPAVKAYRKAGFRVGREFHCFKLPTATARRVEAFLSPSGGTCAAEVEIRPVERADLAPFSAFADWRPSWENSFSSIARIPDEVHLHGGFVDGRPAGLLVYYPLLRCLMSLVVDPARRRRGVAGALLNHFLDGLDPATDEIKAVNIEPHDTATLAVLARVGFEKYTEQFEMELDL